MATPPPSPQCMWLHDEQTWAALASRSTLNIDTRLLQVRIFTDEQDRSRWGHHYGETWPR
jgi:hypothetical protein